MDLCLKETLRLLNEPYRSQNNGINTWLRKVLIAMHISRDLTVSATSHYGLNIYIRLDKLVLFTYLYCNLFTPLGKDKIFSLKGVYL